MIERGRWLKVLGTDRNVYVFFKNVDGAMTMTMTMK